MAQLVIFSDLDGTLLDHHTYSFSAAAPMLSTLSMLSIPCILNTSKTYAELLTLRQQLKLDQPFIVENGAAVWIPKHIDFPVHADFINHGDFWVKAFGPDRQSLIQTAQQLREQFAFTAFSAMTTEQVVQMTGLSTENAELAQQRQFTEPLAWRDSPMALDKLQLIVKPLGIQAQKGGRFVHLMGAACDKAKAMKWLLEQYQHMYEEPVTSVALGDGENDLGMLQAADIPVVVRSPAHAPPEVPRRRDAMLTEQYGPAGWAEALNSILIKTGVL